MTLLVVLVVSGALLVGAAWGIYGTLPDWIYGFLVALAGGALLLSVTSELIQPSIEKSSLWVAAGGVAAGAILFALADYLIDERWGSDSGGGLLAAITLDGVPENMALGVALIGAGPKEVAALAGSILLSNLPEAAGGARDMGGNGYSKAKVLGLWAATAALLSAAALAGNRLLAEAGEETLAAIRCVAAGGDRQPSHGGFSQSVQRGAPLGWHRHGVGRDPRLRAEQPGRRVVRAARSHSRDGGPPRGKRGGPAWGRRRRRTFGQRSDGSTLRRSG